MKNLKHLTGIAIISALVGCGGGGGGGEKSVPVAAGVNTRQNEGIMDIQKETKEGFEAHFERGIPTHISMNIRIPDSAGNDPVAQAFYFFERYKDVYRIKNPKEELFLGRSSTKGKLKTLTFKQKLGDTKVFGAEITMMIVDNRVVMTNGQWVPDLPTFHKPKINAIQARNLALKEFKNGELTGKPVLVILDKKLLGFDEGKPTLTWKVPIRGEYQGIYEDGLLFVNAYTGEVEHFITHLMTAKEFKIIDIKGKSGNPCSYNSPIVYTEGGESGSYVPGTDNILDSLYQWAHDVYDYLNEKFGRDSLDGEGMPYRFQGNWSANNARASGPCLSFGNLDSTIDAVGHEFTHSVITYASGLIYQNQSGALNENLADVFGEFLEQDKGGGADWLVGRRDGSVLRNMKNPPANSDPDHMSGYINTSNDFGGVHSNSGIPNKVAYLITMGGIHYGYDIRGMGFNKAEQLYYTLMVSLPRTANFQNAANMSVRIASSFRDLDTVIGYGFTDQDVCDVRNAWASVGVLPTGDRDCDGVPDNRDSDSDGDGIENSVDNCPTVYNPSQANTDAAIKANHPDPSVRASVVADNRGDACDSDMDGDGVEDAVDDDGDGKPDRTTDNCLISETSRFYVASFNPPWYGSGQTDSDGDGVGDMCEDDDRDGYPGAIDNCPDDWNRFQRDMDGDGRGDLCDSDIDGDGIPNSSDNCVYEANPLQEDDDGDGFGNVCDNCSTPNPSGEDHDGDGFPDQPDFDGDGLGDACDLDDDGDGVADAYDTCPEVRNLNNDFDNDGKDTACDPDESLILQGPHTINLGQPNIAIPIDPCEFTGLSCPNSITDGFKPPITFKVSGQTPAYPLIVDEEGNVVTIGKFQGIDQNSGMSVYDLSFKMSPEARFAAPGTQKIFKGKRYFLKLVPEGNISSVEVQMEVNP